MGAQALFDLGKKRGSLPVSLIEPLMNDPPTVESIASKTIGLQQPDGTILNLRFNADGGVALADAKGNALSEYFAHSEENDPWDDVRRHDLVDDLVAIRARPLDIRYND